MRATRTTVTNIMFDKTTGQASRHRPSRNELLQSNENIKLGSLQNPTNHDRAQGGFPRHAHGQEILCEVSGGTEAGGAGVRAE